MNCWVDEQDAVYPNGGTFCRKKEWGLIHASPWAVQTPCCVKEAGHNKPHAIWLHLYETATTGKSRETESRLAVAKDSEKAGMQSTANGCGVSLWGGEHVLEQDRVATAQHCEGTKRTELYTLKWFLGRPLSSVG